MATDKRQRAKPESIETISNIESSLTSPLVFISHDTRDADLAEAFGNLLTDASGGILRSFRSSDRKGTAGIEFGAEWWTAIMSKLDKATDVVALLTSFSVNRPWILYESGVAKGKLDTPVLGVAIGIKLEQASTGPFAQFQNCDDDVDSLTKLVLQLIKRNPQASPREEAVKRQVHVFIEIVQKIVKARGDPAEMEKQSEDTSVAKMFEEVKVLVRDLPSRFESQLREDGMIRKRRKRRRLHPGMLEEMMAHPRLIEGGTYPSVGLLLFASTVRDEFPWLYELAVDLHRAYQTHDEGSIIKAQNAIVVSSEIMMRSQKMHDMVGPEDEEMVFMMRHILGHLKDFFISSHQVGIVPPGDKINPADLKATSPVKASGDKVDEE